MVSNPEGFTESSPMSPIQYMTVKNPSAIKSLRQFLDTLEFKPKTDVHSVCAAKSKRKSIRAGIVLGSGISKQRNHIKSNQQVKKALYDWDLQHPQVVVSPMANYCLKLSIGGQV